MVDTSRLSFIITNPAELNASYMPFIKDGGLFIPTNKIFSIGDHVVIELRLPDKNDPIIIAGKVVWINPKNALHHSLAGIGVQFMGNEAKAIKSMIEGMLDKTLDVGNYVYGLTWTENKSK